MMRHHPLRLAAVTALVATTFLAACGDDEDDDAAATTTTVEAEAPALEVTGVWARTSPAVATAGAVYLTVTNDGDVDDAVVGVAVDSSIADRAELHETVAAAMDESMATTTMAGDMGGEGSGDGGGMMTMQPVDRIPVPAGASVALEPGGYHVMLLDLAAPLEVGTTIDVTLSFETADDMVVTADVRDVAP